jgi:hypothetical protein
VVRICKEEVAGSIQAGSAPKGPGKSHAFWLVDWLGTSGGGKQGASKRIGERPHKLCSESALDTACDPKGEHTAIYETCIPSYAPHSVGCPQGLPRVAWLPDSTALRVGALGWTGA